jgi:hypothetical protein
MIEKLEESSDNILAFRISGKIKKGDYDILNPAMEKHLIKNDDPKMFIEVGVLDGFTTKALFEELKNIPDYDKFTKIAMVGEKDWKETLTKIFDPIFSPETKYFCFEEKDEALNWLRH